MALQPIKLPSAKEQAAAELRKAILSKQLKEGEAITLESAAKALNVSATPVREAFQTLARDGLIELRKNRGAVVLGITERYIREHYAIRAILESQAARLAAASGNLAELTNTFQLAQQRLQQEDYTDYGQLNFAFHRAVWRAADNNKMALMLSELWNGLSIGLMASPKEYAHISMNEHTAIIKAIQLQDSEAAATAMNQHIMRSMQNMLTYYQ